MKLRIDNFGGIVPRTGDTVLKPNEATVAQNVRLYSGELRSWLGSTSAYVPATAGIDSIYLARNPAASDPRWLVWQADNVRVVRSPIAGDSEIRLYYTGDGVPKKTNWTMLDESTDDDSPVSWLNMGVLAPTTAPTASATSSGSNPAMETRFYVYTYVSTFGTLTEESAPSPPVEVTVDVGEQVELDDFDVTIPSGYNITHIRIYRTLTGELGDGVYAFVSEVTLATAANPVLDDALAEDLGEPISTEGWDEPPSDLGGLTEMPNGMLAGFSGNSVYFCEPYFPHAWPSTYSQAIPERIVGLGSYGNTLVVLTDSFPYAMTGNTPEQITVEKIPLPEACVSAKSIANDGYGVVYASPNGLVGIGPSMRGVITNHLFRRSDWQKYTPTSIVGAIYDGKYIGAYDSTDFGTGMLVVSRDDIPALSTLNEHADAMFIDNDQSAFYYLDPTDNVIYQMDSDRLRKYTYMWRSRRFVLPHGTTFSAIKLDVDLPQIRENDDYLDLVQSIIDANEDLFDLANDLDSNGYATGLDGAFGAEPFNTYPFNGSELQEIPLESATVTATVVIYDENDDVVATLNMTTLDPRRLPPFRTRAIKVEINGTLNIKAVTLASTMQELR